MCEDEGFAQDYAIVTTDNARLQAEVEELRRDLSLAEQIIADLERGIR